MTVIVDRLVFHRVHLIREKKCFLMMMSLFQGGFKVENPNEVKVCTVRSILNSLQFYFSSRGIIKFS